MGINYESKETIELAMQALELPDGDYEIAFVANTEFRLLRDPEDIIDVVDWDLLPDEQEVAMAIEIGTRPVLMPAGYRLIGMRKKERPVPQMVYGIVDFGPLGADAENDTAMRVGA